MKLNGYIGSITNKDGYLYKNGKTDFVIVISKNATVVEKKAADELKLIFSYADVDINIITDENLNANENGKYIALGDTVYFKSLNVTMQASEFKYDGFIIKTLGDGYVIKGVGGLGTVFGAYSLMERLADYVYYADDEIKINKDFGVLKNIDIKEIPTFFGRFAYSFDTSVIKPTGMRTRVNGEFYKWEDFSSDVSPWSSLNDQSYALQILDYTKYAEKHPDWYSFIPGHENFTPPRSYPQICYSKGLKSDKEGGFFDTFINNLINDYIIPEKNKNFFMLGMTDTWWFCDCDECKKAVQKYKYSGLAMKFVNKVADAVEKWRVKNAPERVIYCVAFAYLHLFDAPVVTRDGELYPIDDSVVAKDNVIIQFAPISANYIYPLTDAKHNENSRKSVLGWQKITKNFAIWDYRQDFGTQTFFYPTTITAQANNDLYKSLNVIDVFNQAQPFTAGSPFMFMDNFVRARMHWNADENYKELTTEFNKAYYKNAFKYVDLYLQEFEKYYFVMEKRGYVASVGDSASLKKKYYKLNELENFEAILNKAIDAANEITDVDVKNKVITRVETLTLFYKFAMLFCFTFEIEKSKAWRLITDLERICPKIGLNTFYRRTDTSVYLNEVKKLLNGEIEKSEMFPL